MTVYEFYSTLQLYRKIIFIMYLRINIIFLWQNKQIKMIILLLTCQCSNVVWNFCNKAN